MWAKSEKLLFYSDLIRFWSIPVNRDAFKTTDKFSNFRKMKIRMRTDEFGIQSE